uniref:3'-5' exonuclease domain-containing protein n=1 Tax=Meloidogyne enterolobii TaxID=390850 RepID=A0A6V7WX82_MELEN|nr:unnamed protein product [Meloidogyne enterolobii]
MSDVVFSSSDLIRQLGEIPPEYIGKERFNRLIKICGRLSLRAKDGNITGGQFQMACGPVSGRIDDICTQIDDEISKAEEEKKKILEREAMSTSKQKPKKRKKSIQYNSITTQMPDPLPVGLSLDRTPFWFMEYPHYVIQLAKDLECEQVFAFDLERTIPFRHGTNSKVCLLQISTQNKDFVIDTLANGMKSAVTNYLKQAFENPQIIKIVHGNDDAKWLRTVFDIKIKNVFDTSTSRCNLQQLVYIACGIKLDKRYQTADWMRRPLSRDMVEYARLDTHYLINCWQYLMKTSRTSLSNYSVI